MLYKFFNVRVSGIQEDESELNGFISSKKILNVVKQYDSNLHSWVLCVEYIDGDISTGRKSRVPKIDYREKLGDDKVKLKRYDTWALVRKTLTKKLLKNAYEILYNSEIFELVQLEEVTLEDLRKLQSFNDKKIDEMGDLLITMFKEEYEKAG